MELAIVGYDGSIGVLELDRLTTGAWLDLDLLRQRRKQLGLEIPKPVAARALILRGSLVGGSVVLVVLLSCLVVWLVSRWMEQRQASLAPFVAAYEDAQTRISSTSGEIERLQQSNQALAQGIVGVRSGSALLSEISRVMPKRVQLLKLKVRDSTLEFSGTVTQPLGLDVVNAFELTLEDSPFFQSEGVTLVKAVEVANQVPTQQPKSGGGSKSVVMLNFDLNALFTREVEKITAQQLFDLGSLGSARRRDLLREEGLLQ